MEKIQNFKVTKSDTIYQYVIEYNGLVISIEEDKLFSTKCFFKKRKTNTHIFFSIHIQHEGIIVANHCMEFLLKKKKDKNEYNRIISIVSFCDLLLDIYETGLFDSKAFRNPTYSNDMQRIIANLIECIVNSTQTIFPTYYSINNEE